MRRVAWWGTTASLAICLVGGPVGADEKDSYQSADKIAAAKKKELAEKDGGWIVWPFGDDAKLVADKKAADEARKTDAKRLNRPAPSPLIANEPLNDAVSLLSKEQAKFLRRQQVCDRLRELALESGDAELERQAELLEQRAWWIYEQRTAKAKMTILLPPMGDRDAKRSLANEEPANERRSLERPVRTVKADASGLKTGGEE
jgi:hypothetical protein